MVGFYECAIAGLLKFLSCVSGPTHNGSSSKQDEGRQKIEKNMTTSLNVLIY